jgi:putative SOS response-associated peptidase YedK
MYGRVRLSSDVSEIKLVFTIPPHRPTPNFPPSWNAAPTDLLPVVRYDRKAGERTWPFGKPVRGDAVSSRSITARSGREPRQGKQPFAIALADRGPMAVASLCLQLAF